MDLVPVNQILGPVRDLGEFIRDQRQSAQLSLRALAARTGISNPYLSQVERGLRRPSADILAQIAAGLSISAESLLARAGVLPARPDSHDASASAVVMSIRNDAALSDRQRESLIDIYTAFVTVASPASDSASASHPTSSGATSSTASTVAHTSGARPPSAQGRRRPPLPPTPEGAPHGHRR